MKTHARLIASLLLAAFAAFGLAACTTTPAAAPPPAVASKTTVDLMLEVRSKELDLERTNQMAWLKFAAESKSDMVKGFVMGKAASGSAGPGASSATQTIMQAQAQADATALRREELAERYSISNKAYQWAALGLDFARFDRSLGFQRFQITEGNTQQRYLYDAFRGTQQDAYDFNAGAYTQGSTATLNGVAAGRQPAPAATEATTPAE